MLLGLLTYTGCEEPVTIAKVCKETPGFCADLNKDSHCKDESAEVILKRYSEYKEPTDENKYQLLKEFETYNQCITLAAKIEHIKLKAKKTSRIDGQLTSIKEMTRLYQDTIDTNHPGLLYYHWSRNNNQGALNKLLAIEDDPSVTQSAEMQFFLASYYIKFDDEKTDKTGDATYVYTDPDLDPDIANDIMFCIQDQPTGTPLDVIECL